MSWTPSIQSISKAGGKSSITVLFDNGAEQVSQQYTVDFLNPDLDWLKRQVQLKINQMQQAYDFADSLKVGIIDPTPTPPPTPDPAKQQFFQDYQSLQQMKKAITAGLKQNTDADFIALVTKVKSEYLPAYLTLV